MAQRREQRHKRFRKRVPCQFTLKGRRFSGVVLNISAGGLYVQTNANTEAGSDIQINLTPSQLAPEGSSEAIPLHAKVVWRRVVPQQLRSITQGGLGLRIERASEAYYHLVQICESDKSPGKSQY